MGKKFGINKVKVKVFRTRKNLKHSRKNGESMWAEHTSLELSSDLERTETGIINMLLMLMSIDEIKGIWKFGKWKNLQKRKWMVQTKALLFKFGQINGENPSREFTCKHMLIVKIHLKNILETEAAGVEDKLYKNFVTE